MPVTFYAADTYADVKQKFATAWPHLTIEVHYAGNKLWKEGWDEIDDATILSNSNITAPLGTFTGDTTVDEAMQFFAQHFSGEAFILRQGASVQKNEPLAYCNEPFMLPLSGLTYGQYRRLFKEYWTNLSVQLYDTRNNYTELQQGVRMRYTEGPGTSLHDYIFIADWHAALARRGLYGTIHNDTLGLAFETGMDQLRLAALQALEESTGTPVVSIAALSNFNKRVKSVLQQEGKISAIKFCTDTKGWSLAAAKEYVELLMGE